MKLTNRHLGVLQWAVRRAARTNPFVINNPAETVNHMVMIDDANQALTIIRAATGKLTRTENQALIEERDRAVLERKEAVTRLERATHNIQDVHKNLRAAVLIIQELLEDPDAESKAMANEWLLRPGVQELRAGTGRRGLVIQRTFKNPQLAQLKELAFGIMRIYDEAERHVNAGHRFGYTGGMGVSSEKGPFQDSYIFNGKATLTLAKPEPEPEEPEDHRCHICGANHDWDLEDGHGGNGE